MHSGYQQVGQQVGTLVSGIVLLTFVMFGTIETVAADRNQPDRSLPENWRMESLAPELAVLDSLLAAGRFGEVVDMANDLLVTEDDASPYRHLLEARLGVALLRAGRPADALEPLENAVRGDPLQAHNHRNLATALMQLGRVGRGLTEYRQAVDLAPEDAEIRREYGQSLTALRSWPEAEKQLLVARRLCGICLETEGALADLYLRSGQDAKAVEPLQNLLAVDPNAALRLELAGALHRSGDSRGLVDLLGDLPALELDPRELRLLAEADRKLGLRWRARSWTDQLPAATLLPAASGTDAEFWAVVSLNLIDGKDWEPALKAIDRAVDLDPDNAVYLNNKVVILQRLGRQEEAQRLWQQVLALDPSLGDGQP